jgi:hypothetical protein
MRPVDGQGRLFCRRDIHFVSHYEFGVRYLGLQFHVLETRLSTGCGEKCEPVLMIEPVHDLIQIGTCGRAVTRGTNFVILPSRGILRVHGFIHRDARVLGLFVGCNIGLVFESQSDVVQAFQKDMLAELANFEFVV